MLTQREIAHFATLGEMLGFDAFIEDSKFDQTKGRSRPMDLSWWKWDPKDSENYAYLALHLERENVWGKAIETIEKLFSKTDEGFVPHNVIGIQRIASGEKISALNCMVAKKNAVQQSVALMIYRYDDAEPGTERIIACYFKADGTLETKEAIAKLDQSNYWYMVYEEEQQAIQKKT
ncbi:hypothetical protein [Planococcus sp. YIM B11945]|uniref:hypothetical protein n=1 Tax=Planococcus sp. YIM B11945 TaxID=3435410 RepID=UPI003D7D1D75